MTRSLVLGEKADAEIAEAARWYESRDAGLGDDLIDEVRRTLEMLLTYPEIGSAFADDRRLRQVPIRRFPYYIVFLLDLDADALVVVAFAHFSRRPGYWRDRL